MLTFNSGPLKRFTLAIAVLPILRFNNDIHSSASDLLADLLIKHAPSSLSYISELPEHHWKAYKTELQQCNWRAIRDANYKWDAHLRTNPSAQYPTTFVNLVNAKGCNISDGEFQWHSVRIGPFNSSGGFDHHYIYHSNIVADILPVKRQLYIISTLSMPVDDKFMILSFPSIHVHHSQLSFGVAPDGWRSSEWRRRAIQINHHDSACYPHFMQKGELCFMMQFPSGYGIHAEAPLGFNALLNDARKAESPPQTFFVEVAVRQSLHSPQRAVVMWSTNAFPGPIWSLANSAFGTGVFRVPDVPTVIWSTSTASISGRLLNFWLHSHSDFGLQEAWYINASAHQLGLIGPWTPYPMGMNTSDDQAGFALPHCSQSTFGTNTPDTVEGVKTNILRKMHEQDLRFRCMAQVPKAYVGISLGDRQLPLRCFKGSEFLVQGESLTAIFFLQPIQHVHHPLFHLHYQGFVVPDDPAIAEPYQMIVKDALPEPPLDAKQIPEFDHVCSWEPKQNQFEDPTIAWFNLYGLE